MASADELESRIADLEVNVAALAINTRRLLAVVGQLTGYSEFMNTREYPKRDMERRRGEMDGVLTDLNEKLKNLRDRLPDYARDRADGSDFG